MLDEREEMPDVNVNSSTNLKGFIDDKAWAQAMGFVNATNLECSGFFLYKLEENVANIKRFFLLKSTSTGASVEIDADARAKFYYRLYRHKILYPGSGWLLGWWHSHPTFNVFRSGTDRATGRELAGDSPLYLSLVLNQKGEYHFAADMSMNGIQFSVDKLDMFLVETELKIHDRDYQSESDRKVVGLTWTQPDYENLTTGILDRNRDIPEHDTLGSDRLARILWKLENGLSLMWFEQELWDEHKNSFKREYVGQEAAQGFFDFCNGEY